MTYIEEEVGEGGMAMAKYLEASEPIGSVEILEEHDDVKPAEVRKVLYRLMDAHVAEYEKDTDAKGWETFTWHMTLDNVKHVLMTRWAERRLELEKAIKFEHGHEFYACPEGHARQPFEDAIENGFHCPQCNAAMQPHDNAEIIAAMEAELESLVPTAV